MKNSISEGGVDAKHMALTKPSRKDLEKQLQELKQAFADYHYCSYAKGFAFQSGNPEAIGYFMKAQMRCEDKIQELLERTPAADNLEEMKRKVKEFRL
jgi:hypothetical protein